MDWSFISGCLVGYGSGMGTMSVVLLIIFLRKDDV